MAKKHRTPQQDLPIFPYVTPEGRIVDAQWAPAVSSQVLVADGTGDVAGRTVHVREAARRQGFRLLRELYEAEGKREVFLDYMKWVEAVYRNGHTKDFPEDALPEEVKKRRRKTAAGEHVVWQPSDATKAAMKPATAKPEAAKPEAS